MVHSGFRRWARAAALCLAGVAASRCTTAEIKPVYGPSGSEAPMSKLSPDAKYARITIDKLTASEREALKSQAGIRRWIEVDRQLLVLASSAVIESLKARYSVTTLDVVPQPENLCLIHERHAEPERNGGGTVLARTSRLTVTQVNASGGCTAVRSETNSRSVRPLAGSETVARQLAGEAARIGTDQNPHTRDVVNALDMDRWLKDVETLASFDRYALRASNIMQAKEWIAGQFCAIAQSDLSPEPVDGSPGVRCRNGNMEVRTEPFALGTVGSWNVILTLQGYRTDGPVFVAGAHYDSVAREPGATQAPGAEDNASGAAAIIEMARAVAQYPTDATFVFVAFSGEEQGMVGSKYHVQHLAGTSFAHRIRAVFIMDMIGYSGDAELDCLLETKDTQNNQALVSHLANMAAIYAPDLSLSATTSYWGSDHAPFLDNGYSGVLTMENDYEDYPYYHSMSDTFAAQNERFKSMAGLIVRMNTAAAAEWSIPNTLYAVLSSMSVVL